MRETLELNDGDRVVFRVIEWERAILVRAPHPGRLTRLYGSLGPVDGLSAARCVQSLTVDGR